MKPQKRNKKDRKAQQEVKKNEMTSTSDDISPPVEKKEPPKDIFVDIESDSKTGLIVKDQAKEPANETNEETCPIKTIPPSSPTIPDDIQEIIQPESKPLLDSVVVDMTLENQNPNELLVSSSAESTHSFDVSSLPETLTKLTTANGSEVYLIGTAHFSPKSVEDVEKVIRSVKPSGVVLELCHERAFMLSLDEESLLQQNKDLTMQKVRDAISEKGLTQGLIYVMFVKMSATITEKLGMAPGSEFRAGSREAHKIAGCNVILGDRSIKVTIARAVASINFWQKLKLLYQFIVNDASITQEDVEKCKDKDILESLLQELAGEYPGFKKVLLDERNIYLAHSIYHYAQNSETSLGPQKIVAIVGIGHVGGIVENWGTTTDEQITSLNEMPKVSKTEIVIKKSIKYCSLILLVYIGYRTLVPSNIQDSITTKITNWR